MSKTGGKYSPLTRCREEEFAPFFALIWRIWHGWRPEFLPLRGPNWDSLGCFGLPIGIWLFSRVPRRLVDCDDISLIGWTVSEICPYIGSYGMGGPGFLGIRLSSPRGRTEWLVITLWHASSVVTLDGLLPDEGSFPDERDRLKAKGYTNFVSMQELVGATVADVGVQADKFDLILDCNGTKRGLSILADGSNVPPLRGSGKPRRLLPGESLADAIVLSRRARIWLND